MVIFWSSTGRGKDGDMRSRGDREEMETGIVDGEKLMKGDDRDGWV